MIDTHTLLNLPKEAVTICFLVSGDTSPRCNLYVGTLSNLSTVRGCSVAALTIQRVLPGKPGGNQARWEVLSRYSSCDSQP